MATQTTKLETNDILDIVNEIFTNFYLIVSEKVNFVRLLRIFSRCIVGIYKALRVIGWAQNSPISYPLGVIAKNQPFLPVSMFSLKNDVFSAITPKW